MKIKSSWRSIPVDSSEMGIFVSYPDTAENLPAIILLQEAFGVNVQIRHLAEQFAQQGYYVVTPALYHRTARSDFQVDYTEIDKVMPHYNAVTPETLNKDFQSIMQHLRECGLVNSKLIASIGFCMGGKSSFYCNAVLDLKAAISFYGGGISPDLLQYTHEQKAPILFFWGGKDHLITHEERQSLHELLYEHDVNFLDVIFSKAEHGFFNSERSGFNKEYHDQAWELVLSFLKSNLNSQQKKPL